jgi:hypothetical protein
MTMKLASLKDTLRPAPPKLGRAVALAAALTISAGAAPAGSGAATTGSTAICTNFAPLDTCPRFAQRPGQIAVGTSGRMLLEHLRWSGWGGPSATARGLLRENTGRAGAPHYTYRAARVTASAIGPCAGIQVYEHLLVAVRGAVRIH